MSKAPRGGPDLGMFSERSGSGHGTAGGRPVGELCE